MRPMVVAMVVGLVLVGCGGPPTAADLETVILQDGDLPATIQRGQARHEIPNVYNVIGVPKADVTLYQDLDGGSRPQTAGNVVVSLYNAADMRDDAYSRVAGEFASANIPIEGLVDKSASDCTTVVFTRCNALVRIVLPTEPGAAATYAKRLDKRLQQKVC